MTREVKISVQTHYIEGQSDPGSNRYVFSYTIKISNEGSEPVQLMSRHWIITDANSKVQEVAGDGVVGQQPRIDPGKEFEYTSGAILDTAVGIMEGRYTMIGEDKAEFMVDIPTFTLSIPRTLH